MDRYWQVPQPSTLDIIGWIAFFLMLFILLYIGMRKRDSLQNLTLKIGSKIKRRSSVRVPLNLQVEIVNLDNSRTYKVFVRDLSTGGMKVESGIEAISDIRKFQIRDTTPPWNKIGSIAGRVIRRGIRVNQAGKPQQYVLHCRFQKLPPAQKSILIRELNRLTKAYLNR